MEYWKTPEPTTFVDYDPQSPLCENEYIDLRNLDNVLPLVILLLTLLLNLVVNSLVLRALVMYNGLQSFTTFFFFNLCVSDLVSSFLLLLWVFREHWSLVLCKAVRMTFSLGLYSNMFVPTIMTLYLSVVRPQCMPLDLNLRCRVLLAAAMWVASVLSSIPDAIFFEVIDDQCTYSGTLGLQVSVYVHNFMFLLSMVTIFFCYRQTRRTLFTSMSRGQRQLILAIMVVFVLIWAPYNLILFLQILVNIGVIQSCKTRLLLDWALTFFETLPFLQLFLHLLLYCHFVKFHTDFRNLCQRCVCSCVNYRCPALPCCPSLRSPSPMRVPPST
ncbi:chemokine XC receptor 1-like [Cavia porcellus]|uniref:chemokine XC receptor 1-like n=1 Tax=Cavia porcellus TaxID=10141 RepID=UPI000661CCD4|nr:chemokine XC receptor 1-like isoform X1 [Cavia porcellus]XP_023416163.1 chemokine XC receptor 1-like isoform X1 [Cavia porcellus]